MRLLKKMFRMQQVSFHWRAEVERFLPIPRNPLTFWPNVFLAGGGGGVTGLSILMPKRLLADWVFCCDEASTVVFDSSSLNMLKPKDLYVEFLFITLPLDRLESPPDEA